MADDMSAKKRSYTMSRIRSKDTIVEVKFRKLVWEKGYRYRLHYKIAGTPDIVFPSKKIAVFVDGCFWHKCPKHFVKPQSNKKYWLPKIERNAKRDRKNEKELKTTGWKVIRFWGHEIEKKPESAGRKLIKIIIKRKS